MNWTALGIALAICTPFALFAFYALRAAALYGSPTDERRRQQGKS